MLCRRKLTSVVGRSDSPFESPSSTLGGVGRCAIVGRRQQWSGSPMASVQLASTLSGTETREIRRMTHPIAAPSVVRRTLHVRPFH
jgi:hypothetical protein